jgi:hypothetical protein
MHSFLLPSLLVLASGLSQSVLSAALPNLGAPALRGATCGGFLGIVCGENLVCEQRRQDLDGRGKPIADAAGICVMAPNDSGIIRVSDFGGKCGTIFGIQCAASLVCDTTGSKALDAAGKCVRKPNTENVVPGVAAELGATCGTMFGITCGSGLQCEFSNEKKRVADAAGVCVRAMSVMDTPRVGELGGRCGGFLGTRCGEGLQCETKKNVKGRVIADSTGLCVRGPTLAGHQ